MFRKAGVGILGSLLTSALLTMAITATVITTFTGTHIKHWLKSHDTYQNLVDNVIKENKDTNVGSGSNNVSVDQSEVQAALKKTITPEFLQKVTEQFIDGTEPWLKGKTPKPTFQIDVSNVKMNLAGNLADVARARYNSLPACARGQIPSTTNPLEVECRVPGVSVDTAVAQLQSDIINSKDFLPDQVITSDNLTQKNKDGSAPQQVFDQLHNLPKIYKWVHISPWIFGFLGLLCAGAIILISSDKRKGVKRVSISLLCAGLLLVVVSILGSLAFHKADDRLVANNKVQNVVVQDSVLPVIRDIENSLVRMLVIFGMVFIGLYVAAIIYLKMRPNHKLGGPKDHETPISQDDESSHKPSRPEHTPTIVSG